MIDNVRRLETPEGVELSFKLAGLVPRSYAFLVDVVVRLGILMTMSELLVLLGGFGIGLYTLLIFLIEWWYPVLFECFAAGQTPGKKVAGVRVVQDDGRPVSASTSIIRNFIRVADFLPLGYATGILMVLLRGDNKRLGDLAAGTIVVHADSLQADSMTQIKATPQPILIPLSQEERRAIVAFAERGQDWSRSRRIEIADHLEPLTGKRGEEGVIHAFGMARWMGEER